MGRFRGQFHGGFNVCSLFISAILCQSCGITISNESDAVDVDVIAVILVRLYLFCFADIFTGIGTADCFNDCDV